MSEVNLTLTESPITLTAVSSVTNTLTVSNNATANLSVASILETPASLDDLSDVETTGVSVSGQMLVWNSTAAYFDFSPVWNDIILQVSNLRPGNTPPVFAAFRNGVYGLRFDANTGDEVHGAFEVVHDYKEGTDMVAHCHWSPTSTDIGNIVFGFEYTHANDSQAFSTTATATNTPVAASGVVNQLTRTNIVTLDGTNYKIGDIIAFRFYRQNGGTDTFTGNAFVHSIGIHYQADTNGSINIASKT